MRAAILFLLIWSSLPALADDAPKGQPSMPAPWFTSEDCQSLEIKKHRSISKHQIVASGKITDADLLKRIIWRINRIPADGQMMKSFGENAKHTELEFTCQGKVQVIDIFGERFKTPSTGFNTEDTAEEKLLVAAIDGFLEPDFGKIILKAKGRDYAFKGFKLAFKETTRFDHAPATISGQIDHFVLKPDGGPETPLEIRSGQIAPQPLDFSVGKSRYTLLTFESQPKKSAERLYPDFFQVIRAKTGKKK